MITAGLALEQAPPFSVPLRFFLTAPLFLLLAAGLLLWQGPDVFTSRWQPATLALTHLLTLGFMAQVMLGALLQILPVVVGVVVPRPRLTAALIHLPLTLGTLALAAAFLGGGSSWFQGAAALLGLGFGVALLAILIALWRAPVANETVIALRCALGALLVTIVLGMLLSSVFAWGWSFPLFDLVHLHAGWGLIGWTVLLVAGVAYQVVPMFQITPPYPAWLRRGFAPLLTVLLAIWSICMLLGWQVVAGWTSVMLAAAAMLLAGTTLWVLSRRRRKIGDPTLNFWRASMSSLLMGAVLWLLAPWIPAWASAPQLELLLGVLAIFGFAVAAINGMLYKIVPFLSWFHLQAQLFRRVKVPNMKQLLPYTSIQQQWWSYLVALLLLLAAVIEPPVFGYPAALALGVSSGWLGINLLRVYRIYDQVLRSAPPLPSAA
ncbi:MAG: hypothetical protein IAF00_01125 [Phycisphaerales bacterium]|nr:hypothetical protein [Phycisphaerales bacterium]